MNAKWIPKQRGWGRKKSDSSNMCAASAWATDIARGLSIKGQYNLRIRLAWIRKKRIVTRQQPNVVVNVGLLSSIKIRSGYYEISRIENLTQTHKWTHAPYSCSFPEAPPHAKKLTQGIFVWRDTYNLVRLKACEQTRAHVDLDIKMYKSLIYVAPTIYCR